MYTGITFCYKSLSNPRPPHYETDVQSIAPHSPLTEDIMTI